jgi:acyl dehydratase
MNLVLDRMPEPGLLKAFGTLGRKPRGEVVLPQISVKLDGVRFEPKRLEAYRRICGFPDGPVPIPYPQVNAVSLHMHLMTRPQFPLPLVGLVHLRNVIEQTRELMPDESFAVEVAILGHKTTDKGLEFDLETTYRDAAEKIVWRAVTTILRRGKQPKKHKGAPPVEDAQLSEYRAIDAPDDIGRRYGRIAGDMNPIHLYPVTAKLLGFDRHIAHGMWSMARCCALLLPELGRVPVELTTQFKQPLFLPARAAMRYGHKGPKGQPGSRGDALAFRLIGRDSGKVHLDGALR